VVEMAEVRYDEEGGAGWDTYSGERVRTTASQHWDGHRRSKSEREAKDNLEKDGGEGKKQGGMEELGSSQSGGTEQGVLVGKRDGLMRLLGRREMMMMMMKTKVITPANHKGRRKSSEPIKTRRNTRIFADVFHPALFQYFVLKGYPEEIFDYYYYYIFPR